MAIDTSWKRANVAAIGCTRIPIVILPGAGQTAAQERVIVGWTYAGIAIAPPVSGPAAGTLALLGVGV